MGDLKPPSGLQAQPAAGLETRGVSRQVRAFGRGAAGYGVAAASTAGVFGVFVGMVNAGTCGCERLRGYVCTRGTAGFCFRLYMASNKLNIL